MLAKQYIVDTTCGLGLCFLVIKSCLIIKQPLVIGSSGKSFSLGSMLPSKDSNPNWVQTISMGHRSRGFLL